MRRHAKATSAGSIEGSGALRARIRRAFAIRGASSGFNGSNALSGRRHPKLLLALAGAVILTTLVLGVSLAAGAAPTVTIENASNVEYTTAHVKGTVDPGGEPTTYRFQYATQADFSDALTGLEATVEGSGAQTVEGELAGLAPNTTYHLRLLAENSESAGVPSETVAAATFPTKAVAKPTVSVEAITTFTGTTATFSGHVNPNAPEAEPTSPKVEGAFATEWRFRCTPECPGARSQLKADNTFHEVVVEQAGLLPGTPYEIVLFAENAGGEAITSPVTFTTPPVAPTVDSSFVTEVGTSEATLGARIDPGGAATTYHFEYVTREQFEEDEFAHAISTPESASIGSDNEDHTASATVTSLQPGTDYVFRAVAQNSVEAVAGTPHAFSTFAAEQAFPACPNDALRQGYGAALPDCRAYEQVTPTDKNGAGIFGFIEWSEASPSGNNFSFIAPSGIPVPNNSGQQDYPEYLAGRGFEAWSTQGLFPPPSSNPIAQVLGWSEDLSWVVNSVGNGFEEELFLRDSSTGSTQPVVRGQSRLDGVTRAGAVVFESNEALAPGALAGVPNLFVWDRSTGNLALASVLPVSEGGESPPAGAFAGSYEWVVDGNPSVERHGTVAAHGEVPNVGASIVFTAKQTGQLYLRQDSTGPSPSTVRVSASQKTNGSGPGGTDPNGPQPAAFLAATPDGSRIFFTSCEQLTDDSTAASPGPESGCYESGGGSIPGAGSDLYRYDVGTGDLTDLTVDHSSDPVGADVRGILGTSSDGSSVYLVANGILASNEGASGTHASLGDCSGAGDGATGVCNLYLFRAGEGITFISHLNAAGASAGDARDWTPSPEAGNNGVFQTARVSADGSVVLFASKLSLTAYESNGALEYYRYDSSDHALNCVSCIPTGAPPAASSPANLLYLEPPTQAHHSAKPSRLPRNLSSNGTRVFFTSQEALVPGDTNGTYDAYEWEVNGTGTCHGTSEDGGCLYLLSSGTSAQGSTFVTASANGDDAFVSTSQSLAAQDQDQLSDVYDVKVNGGIAAQNLALAPGCSGEECRVATAGPSSGPSAGSSVFAGPGNPKSCPPDKRLSGGKCVKPKQRHHKHKHHKKKKNSRRTHRRAGTDRRDGK